jgi:putative DNA primase/helicase
MRAIGMRMSDLFPPRNTSADSRGRIVAAYDYVDENGELLFQVTRWVPKDFRQRRPDGKGGWKNDIAGVRRVLYRLPEILAADVHAPVIVVEGEKDADNLAALGFVATTSSGGADKWRLTESEPLRGRLVIIGPDNDAKPNVRGEFVGYKHAHAIAADLAGKAKSVRWVRWPAKDFSDWSGATAADVQALIDSAADVSTLPPYTATAEQIPTPDADADPDAGPIPLGQRDPETGRIVFSPTKTLPTALAFIDQFYSHRDGRTLHNYDGQWLAWKGNRYVEIAPDALKNRLLPWLHDAARSIRDRDTNGFKLVAFESNPHTVNGALDTLKSVAHLSTSETMPHSIEGYNAPCDAAEILCGKTYNLHIPSGRRIDPTPSLINTAALSYDHDPSAPRPAKWLGFVDQLFGDDQQSRELFQEWFGYCLTGDKSQEKIMLFVGPRRAGKGVSSRILARMIGLHNVANPTTSSLSKQFGLQGLVGKSLAIIGDARFRGDGSELSERLLSLSGGDSIDVERKFLPALHTSLPTRFLILSNELPKFADASGALPSRFMILQFRQSFYGKEDHGLEKKLLAELPGILNWSIEGWKRLRDRGRFVQPESSTEAVQDMEDLASPIGAFVRDRCAVGADKSEWVEVLYAAWRGWCESEGRDHPGTVQSFSRDLKAFVPGIRTKRHGRGFFEGIELVPAV